MPGSVPGWFTREYLRAKGFKEAFGFACWTCGARGDAYMPGRDEQLVDHPVRWLWGHASLGHEAGVNLAFSWKRRVGGGPRTNVYERWARWWWATWDPAARRFAVEAEVTFRDGEDVAYCSDRKSVV